MEKDYDLGYCFLCGKETEDLRSIMDEELDKYIDVCLDCFEKETN